MIRIENGRKAFKDLVIFDGVNLLIDKPGLYFVQGCSGSGKSTLLNLLAGFESFDSGGFEIDKNIATIFQNYELIQELNVEENIFLCVKPNVTPHMNLINELGLTKLLKNYPNELSGGQKQRVGIARALLLNPNIILCDEPTESLDIENKIIVMDLLKKMATEKIIIVASHDQKIVDEYAEHVFYLENHNIVSKSEFTSNRKVIYNSRKEISKEALSKCIHKIIIKRTLILTGVIFLLSCFLQVLFIYEKKLFYIPDSVRVLNANMVYLQVVGSNEKYQTPEFESIVEFSNIEFDSVELERVNVYPFIENQYDLTIVGELPKENGVLVNQNVLDELGIKKWENNVLDSTYLVGVEEEELPLKITGVILEEETNLLNIYYNLEDVLTILDGIEYTDYVSQRKYIEVYGMNFQKKVGYFAMSDYYNSIINTGDVSLKSPLYDERTDMISGLEIFKFVFKMVELSLLIILIVFVFVSMNYDANNFAKNCSILCSQGIKLESLKKIYINKKIMYLFPLLGLSTLIAMVIGLTLFSNVLVVSDYIIILAIGIVVIVVYLLALLFAIVKIKTEKIAQILKNEF